MLSGIMRKNTGCLVVVFVSVIVASCTVSRPYSAPEIKDETLYRHASGSDTNSLATVPHTALFSDTILQNLITEGLRNNLDLKAAFERINQAQAYYRQSGAALMPTLSANGSVSYSKLSDIQKGQLGRSTATQYQFGLSSSWEIDFWGKLSSTKRANLANVLQTQAGERAVKTELVAAIAGYYYTLLALDRQLSITTQTVRTWDTTVQTMRALKDAARVTEAAVVQSQAQRYAAEVTIPDLKRAIRETENSLSILLGRNPGPIKRSTISAQFPMSPITTGLPSQLLSNRPDVQAAELNFRYYFEMTNAARAFFYPAVSLTASAAYSALKPVNLFDAGSLAASIAGGVFQPIFNQRANRTRLAVSESQQRTAILDFQSTVLNAGKEVSDALYLHDMAIEKMMIRSNQMDALEKSVLYTQELLKNGFATYTEVINARQLLLQAQLGGVNDHLQQLQSIVQLYRALGGGWRNG